MIRPLRNRCAQRSAKSPIRMMLGCAGVLAATAGAANAGVFYNFVKGDTGAILGTAKFAAPPASATSAWAEAGAAGTLTGLTLDYTSLGGPVFNWGSNITFGGSDGFIDNISANTITSDGPTLNGGGTAARRFFTTVQGQTQDPRFQVQASIGASATSGADTFGIAFGGSNGGAIDPQWVGFYYQGDWILAPTPGAATLLSISGLIALRRRR